MLKNPLHKVCLLRCGELHLVLPITDLISIELAEDIQPVLQKESATGSVEGRIALPQGHWRVLLLDPDLNQQHYLSKTHRYVACLRATEFGANGLLCDEAITLTDHNIQQNYVPLPSPMHTDQQVFQQLMRYQDKIALVSDAQRLGAYCASPNKKPTSSPTSAAA